MEWKSRAPEAPMVATVSVALSVVPAAPASQGAALRLVSLKES